MLFLLPLISSISIVPVLIFNDILLKPFKKIVPKEFHDFIPIFSSGLVLMFVFLILLKR
jgi:hypothetical protein